VGRTGGWASRRYRAPLVVALVGVGAFGAVGLNAPGALRAVAGGLPAAPSPSLYLCVSHADDRWVCDGAPPADPMRPLAVGLAATD
jgi:hypothetical protein